MLLASRLPLLSQDDALGIVLAVVVPHPEVGAGPGVAKMAPGWGEGRVCLLCPGSPTCRADVASDVTTLAARDVFVLAFVIQRPPLLFRKLPSSPVERMESLKLFSTADAGCCHCCNLMSDPPNNGSSGGKTKEAEGVVLDL